MNDLKISTLSSLTTSLSLADFTNPSSSSNKASLTVSSPRHGMRKMQHQLAVFSSIQPSPSYVGELGELWQFPSDHLPIGISINNFHFASWNILNKDYLHHIAANSQGLKDSLIMQMNKPSLTDDRLTLREELVIEQVLSLLQHPEYPRSALCLQETGENFWEVLKERLPSKFKTLTTFPDDLAHGDVFIYDADLFAFEMLTSQKYDCHPANTMMCLTLRDRSSNQLYRIIQSHIPGGPIKSEPARKEFADFVLSNFDPSMAIVIMGDMNGTPQIIQDHFKQSASTSGIEQPYTAALPPYPTHVNTHKEASWIDNIFYSVPNGMNVRVSNEKSFFPAVQETANLLNERFI